MTMCRRLGFISTQSDVVLVPFPPPVNRKLEPTARPLCSTHQHHSSSIYTNRSFTSLGFGPGMRGGGATCVPLSERGVG
ncbi:hypothetical protein BDN70DRAFT_665684 [Pholiota conissans]|uniref:Uncharacterized protein n=1 Tax=Pholiota conissans TaxID=109636 RepID=A0A9P5YJW5_9AGAR|nr:hypothetical protein BDN70DRAFT_665684 [Pholiota conissans]